MRHSPFHINSIAALLTLVTPIFSVNSSVIYEVKYKDGIDFRTQKSQLISTSSSGQIPEIGFSKSFDEKRPIFSAYEDVGVSIPNPLYQSLKGAYDTAINACESLGLSNADCKNGKSGDTGVFLIPDPRIGNQATQQIGELRKLLQDHALNACKEITGDTCAPGQQYTQTKLVEVTREFTETVNVALNEIGHYVNQGFNCASSVFNGGKCSIQRKQLVYENQNVTYTVPETPSDGFQDVENPYDENGNKKPEKFSWPSMPSSGSNIVNPNVSGGLSNFGGLGDFGIRNLDFAFENQYLADKHECEVNLNTSIAGCVIVQVNQPALGDGPPKNVEVGINALFGADAQVEAKGNIGLSAKIDLNGGNFSSTHVGEVDISLTGTKEEHLGQNVTKTEVQTSSLVESKIEAEMPSLKIEVEGNLAFEGELYGKLCVVDCIDLNLPSLPNLNIPIDILNVDVGPFPELSFAEFDLLGLLGLESTELKKGLLEVNTFRSSTLNPKFDTEVKIGNKTLRKKNPNANQQILGAKVDSLEPNINGLTIENSRDRIIGLDVNLAGIASIKPQVGQVLFQDWEKEKTGVDNLEFTWEAFKTSLIPELSLDYLLSLRPTLNVELEFDQDYYTLNDAGELVNSGRYLTQGLNAASDIFFNSANPANIVNRQYYADIEVMFEHLDGLFTLDGKVDIACLTVKKLPFTLSKPKPIGCGYSQSFSAQNATVRKNFLTDQSIFSGRQSLGYINAGYDSLYQAPGNNNDPRDVSEPGTLLLLLSASGFGVILRRRRK
ncbi:hypothetical protein KUL156_62120 [Alteromonas sp. KUL156]|nr:hypothetical protein KUL154_46000 [Alteromonas sp. KUL154]GFE03620.1 hypothetical protein KUL156_62120 [Alteromonas sp. KUL156]